MTVVEFFACSPIENMISCFSLKPDKVIFVGDGRRMKRRVKAYEELARRLGINACFEFRSVVQNSVNKICDVLIEIVETERDCCFDLTGGSELALVAMGRVFQLYEGERHLQMQRFNIATGRLIDCDNDGEVPAMHMAVSLKVEESVALHGGRVVQRLRTETLTDREDILALWEICKKKAAYWNTGVNMLGELLAFSHYEDGGSRAVIDIRRCNGAPGFLKKFEAVKDFVSELARNGLLKNVKENDAQLSFSYKNASVKKCLSKAGNVLEYKALLLAEKLEKDGEKVYNDCAGGVLIDWDGVKAADGFEGTVNEIDLVLMRGYVPVFISCKNGGVDDSELYKLSSVANEFGGKYAKKVLLATDLNKRGRARDYFLQRASDMDIRVISGANRMTDKEFAEQLLKI